MSDATEDEKMFALERFAREVASALGLDLTVGENGDIDVAAVLDLASVAAHSVLRPAAPLTTYLVGFAAGQASAAGKTSSAVAFASANLIAQRVAREYRPAAETP